MKTAALIVSGGHKGASPAFDPLQMVGSISVTQRLIMTYSLAGVHPIVVMMSGQECVDVERHAAHMGAVFLSNDDPGAEMFDNIRIGLRYLQELAEQVLISPVDVPMVSADTIRRLASGGHRLAVPEYAGKRGHPVLIARALIPSILEYRGDKGLRGAMQNCGDKPSFVPVPDPGVLVNSTQSGEAEALAASHDLRQWRPVVKLQIARESTFLGPGSRQLLYLIDTTGSVRLACQQMGMSYSKAWKVLNSLEAQLGFQVVSRKKGGAHGGETRLTQQGAELLRRFDAYEKECLEAIGDIFRRHFQTE